MTKEFAYEVLQNGEELGNWACDRNREGELESNTSVEHLIAYKGKYYLILTDELDILPEGYSEVKEKDLEKDDFILDLIEKHKNSVV